LSYILFVRIIISMSNVAAAETAAADALTAIVRAGARVLEREPWRVMRIVRGADSMSMAQLGAELARRRRAGPPSDLNVAIALAQLHTALQTPEFALAWSQWLSDQRGD
jgi:hypothetical protein